MTRIAQLNQINVIKLTAFFRQDRLTTNVNLEKFVSLNFPTKLEYSTHETLLTTEQRS